MELVNGAVQSKKLFSKHVQVEQTVFCSPLFRKISTQVGFLLFLSCVNSVWFAHLWEEA